MLLLILLILLHGAGDGMAQYGSFAIREKRWATRELKAGKGVGVSWWGA